ncbi:hypothetical protein [Carboxylicivirga sp. RSCT41]|uniref:hypothetical protein n=1 Tax=Carboxylicivirga agarovorans TaxID=3417570 RepID=UPI003D32BA7A
MEERQILKVDGAALNDLIVIAQNAITNVSFIHLNNTVKALAIQELNKEEIKPTQDEETCDNK